MPPHRKEHKTKKNQPRKKTPSKAKKRSVQKEGAFPVVGLGASVGRVEAFETFFKNLPADSGMASSW
jgi:two-component system, chemotaxis family, CheB/CheR fusion protein